MAVILLKRPDGIFDHSTAACSDAFSDQRAEFILQALKIPLGLFKLKTVNRPANLFSRRSSRRTDRQNNFTRTPLK